MHTVTAIIPAYNEAMRLADVLQVVKQSTLIHEIIVVDDGSQDETAHIAVQHGVRALRLPFNFGKGSAMHTGAVAARGDILLFLDADLRALTTEQVDSMIRPVISHEVEMTIGVFKGGRALTDLAQLISPNISGQRCLYRDFFLATPLVDGSRSGVEVLITAHARACKVDIAVVTLAGATHCMKEEKLGTWPGACARWRMYSEILFTLARYHLATRLPARRYPGVGES